MKKLTQQYNEYTQNWVSTEKGGIQEIHDEQLEGVPVTDPVTISDHFPFVDLELHREAQKTRIEQNNRTLKRNEDTI